MILPPEFYAQNACVVARALLGARLVRILPCGERLSGMIVETEAYTGLTDLASHAHRGRTPRNAPMFEAPARSYVYLTYGIHWLLNAVCEPADQPAAVLIRAIEPLEGIDLMKQNRHMERNLTNGPARLTQALAITGADNRAALSEADSTIWIEAHQTFADEAIQVGARIGMGQVPEPWFSQPWRWWINKNPYVSR